MPEKANRAKWRSMHFRLLAADEELVKAAVEKSGKTLVRFAREALVMAAEIELAKDEK